MKWLIIIILSIIAISGYCQIRTCVDVVNPNTKITGSENGVYDYNSRWTNGAVIRVMFLGGSSYVREKIKYYSKIWENYANISFKFIESGTPDILISFESGEGSWSYIGTNSRYYASQLKPSMNFGWFTNFTDDNEFKRTILHEFGHALGLLHEHKNPYGNILWNLPVVYNYYQSLGWSINQINENVISKYSVTLSNHKYDRYSIMHYPVPASFTTDGYSVTMNSELSEGDKEIIMEMYPKSEKIVIINDPTETPFIKKVSCNLENIEIEHNILQNNQKGMGIYLSFTISNAEFTSCMASAYFYYSNGTPLKDFNNSYKTTEGNIASSQIFRPTYPNTKYNRLEIFMPFDELEMTDGEHDLKFSVSIWNSKNEELIKSGSYFFTLSKGIICKDFEVLANFNNVTSTMAVMPKFTINNAQNLTCSACVYFYYQDGTPVTTVNYSNLSFCQSFTPAYRTTLYNNNYFSDLYINVPYNSINIPYGTYNLKYFVALFNGKKQFATSEWYNITFSRN